MRLALGLLACLVFAACLGDPGLDRENVAFMESDDGHILVLTCAGIEPDTVVAWQDANENRVIGDAGDVLLDSVSSDDFVQGPAGLMVAELEVEFDGATPVVDPGSSALLESDLLMPDEVALTDERVMSVSAFADLVAKQDECELSS